MSKKILLVLLLFLIPLALAQDFSRTYESYDGKVYIEDKPAPFLFTEQSVIESQVTSGKILTGDEPVRAELIYLSKEFNALDYRIYVYYYDTFLKEHSKLVYTKSFGRSLNKGERRQFTFSPTFPIDNVLTSRNENHYIGVVGVLRLKVPISELSQQQILNGECFQDTCWIYERFNSVGDIGTNAFNPPFFYSVPQTKQCSSGYINKPFCDGNIIRQDYIEQDCTKISKMVTSCGFNDCISGSCIETSCQLTGKVISQQCTDNNLIRQTYDKDCNLIDQNIGVCDDSDNDISPPDTNKLENQPYESCLPVNIVCADGTEIELFNCVNGELTSNEQCPSSDLKTSKSPTTKSPTSLTNLRALINNNPGITFLVILLTLTSLFLVARRFRK